MCDTDRSCRLRNWQSGKKLSKSWREGTKRQGRNGVTGGKGRIEREDWERDAPLDIITWICPARGLESSYVVVHSIFV